jgi:hypothetical protein
VPAERSQSVGRQAPACDVSPDQAVVLEGAHDAVGDRAVHVEVPGDLVDRRRLRSERDELERGEPAVEGLAG